MAQANSNQLSLSAQGLASLSVVRQIGLWVGVAASIAIGITVALWSQTPNYRSLFTGLSERDVMEVTGALQKGGIPFQLSGAGVVMVPADQIDSARMKLAGQGLPNSTSSSFETLNKEQNFGSSQFMEQARYQRALEGELALTISKLKNVENARVHLAIPKQSSFVRNQKKPHASVFISLFAGRNLDEGQVAAIVHLIASSIANLEPENVSVIDQKGRLLTSPDANGEMGATTGQFEHRKRLEEYLTRRIEALITPIVGVGGVSAQVTTELDYSATEQTHESFNPDLPAVRSEQTSEERLEANGGATGVPGALTNQPPAAGVLTPGATAGASQSETKTVAPAKTNSHVTRNYELDRTVSHTRMPAGVVRRMSVAVLVDNKQVLGDKGSITRQPLTKEELERMTTLIKEAVGFDPRRGDTVSVINEAFTQPEPPAELPAISLLETPWVWQAGKIALGVFAVLIAFFGVLRPVMRSLAEKGAALPPPAMNFDPSLMTQEQLALMGSGQTPQLTHQSSYDTNLTSVRTLVQQDPKRVAQVVKQWVSEES
ncbi:MAG: flagellar M-ring protein FliF [Halothiobacillaceae bacterium]|nr:MAG: flagellar M-ring protein FliF [Halothiobacillaceae bacterium]